MQKKSLPSSHAPRAGERHARCAEHLMKGCDFSVAKGSWQMMGVREASCFSRKRFSRVREGNVSEEPEPEPGSARVQGEVGEIVELGEG